MAKIDRKGRDMKNLEGSNMVRNSQRVRSNKVDKEGTGVRRQEIKCITLFDLVERDYKQNGHKSRVSLVSSLKHLEPYFGERSAERVTTSIVEEYKTNRRTEGAAPSTVNLELAVLRRGYNLGSHIDLIKHKPRITMFKLNNARRGFFELKDYQAVLEKLPYEMRNILRFGYLSGWRKGEIFGLRWDQNYDEAGNTIRIYDSKSGEGRLLPLQGELLQIIEQQKERRVPGCALIFHHNGRIWLKGSFHPHWVKACKLAGVNKHFHDLRRTAVRNLTRAGVPRVIAKKLTGHKTDSVYERYDIVDEEDLRTSLVRVATYLDSKGGENKEKQAKPEENLVSEVPEVTTCNSLTVTDHGERVTEIPEPTDLIPNRMVESKPLTFLQRFTKWFTTK